MQAVYAWQQTGEQSIGDAKKMLAENLLKVHEIYLFLLEFPVAFAQYLESELEAEKRKYYPDKTRIRDCKMLHANACANLIHNEALNFGRRSFKADWSSQAEHFAALFETLRECDFVRDHLVFDEPDFQQQKDFIDQLFEYLILGSERFHGIMEDVYAAWNDDEDSIFREIKKTVESAKNAYSVKLCPKPLQSDEDIVYGLNMLDRVCTKGTEFEKEISEVTENWDPGRIAVLDLIALKMALAEYLYCPEIPVKVTINEYLDIIKDYSTPGSSRFLNGILDKLRKKLEAENRIQKSGRGLRER